MYALVDIDMCPRIGMVARDDYVDKSEAMGVASCRLV
jgi:hypothetical protein